MLRSVALATAILSAGPALAEPSPCASYETVAASLLERYRETPVARMLSDRGFVIEVLASADGATATVLGIQAGGLACVLATGSAYAVVSAAVTGRGG